MEVSGPIRHSKSIKAGGPVLERCEPFMLLGAARSHKRLENVGGSPKTPCEEVYDDLVVLHY